MPYENLREYDNDDVGNGAAWGGVLFVVVLLSAVVIALILN